MKFIVDAHLPQRLKAWPIAQGFDTVHTIDLPKANETEDLLIADFSEKEGRIVITKNSDFLKLYILKGKPSKLFLITTGNIVNEDLPLLFEKNFKTVMKLSNSYDVFEMNNSFVLGHNP
jgi:Uncharacterized protein conserved in bacteria